MRYTSSMAGPPSEAPSERDAARLVELALGERAVHVHRFTTGLAHYVYDVVTDSGRAVVARIARSQPPSIAHAVAWSERLRPLGVPLPALLHADAEARLLAWPSMLLERLPGTDIGHAYAALSTAQKADIARGVCAAQALVQALPPARGYGLACTYEEPLLPTWQGVVEASLARSRARIAAAGVVDPAHVERVAELVPSFGRHFAAIAPRPFMDDTTTKNVIVHEGRLAGIVDVDALCFGDPLFTVGLTRASLLELGQQFNRSEAGVVPAQVAHLEGVLAASLGRLGSGLVARRVRVSD
jgi:hypothetical protein